MYLPAISALEPIARAAGDAILAIYCQPFAVEYKQDESPLTAADQGAHEVIVQALARLTPDIPVLSEESDAETMQDIVEVHFPGIKPRLVAEALRTFYEIRDTPGLKKKPSTSELLDWLKLLLVDDVSPETLREKTPGKLIPPLHGALLKNEQDVHLFERLVFMARNNR